MAFRKANFKAMAKFNSSVSNEILTLYESNCLAEAIAESEKLPHKTFAPSSARCKRRSWFRLRGVKPDKPKPDLALNFTAKIGEYCHKDIQSHFSKFLGDAWVSPKVYLDSHPTSFNYEFEEGEYETKISISNPPVRFACDGIIKYKEKYYLLEIKTIDRTVWERLERPMDKHIKQIEYYCTLLGLSHVLFLYRDRQYGGIKMYEVRVSDIVKSNTLKEIQEVEEAVKSNLPPDKLPAGDAWCSPSQCPYYKVCKEWG